MKSGRMITYSMVLNQDKLNQILGILNENPSGLSITDLSYRLDMNRNSVAKYLDVLTSSGKIEMHSYGAARVYSLTRRVPLAAFLKFTSDMVLILDYEENVIQANEQFLEFFGLKKEQVLGKHVVDLPVRLFPGRRSSANEDLPKRESISELLVNYRGVDMFFRVKFIPSVFDDGSQGVFLVMEDITLQKRHDKEIEESEARYRAVVQQQTEMIVRFLSDGRITFANDPFFLAFGITPEPGKEPFLNHLIPEVFSEAMELAAGGQPAGKAIDIRIDRPGNEPLWHQWTVRTVGEVQGNIMEYQAVGRDITVQRTAEERIAQYIQELRFLSGSVVHFVRCRESQAIFRLIARDIGRLYPEALRVISFSFCESGFITIESISDPGQGSGPRSESSAVWPGMRIPLREEDCIPLRSGDLVMGREGISRLFLELMEQETGEELELNSAVSVGLTSGTSILGGVAVIGPLTERVGRKTVLSTYLHHASMAIERAIIEKHQKESEERFRNITRFSPFPIAIIDMDGTYLFVNDKFREVFGYTPQEVRNGRDWFNLAYPDPQYRELVKKIWISDLVSADIGEARPRIFSVTCKDGTRKDILFRPVTMDDKSQFIVYEDVTEREHAERTKNLLAALVLSSDDAIIGKTVEGKILAWNPGASRLYGYSEDEMIGKDIRVLVPDHLQPEFEELLGRVRSGERISHFETQRVRKDGKIKEVSITMSPIRDKEGRIVGASSIVKDITDVKAEKRLKELESRYRTLVNNINVGFYRSTGDPTGRFVWGNTSLLRILGYESLDELKTVEIAGLFVESNGRAYLLEELFRTGFVKNKEFPIRRKDGTRINVRVTAVAKFDQKGNISSINGVVEDVTEIHMLEDRCGILLQQVRSLEANHPGSDSLPYEVLMGLDEPVAVLDCQGKPVFFNRAFSALTGLVEGRDKDIHFVSFIAGEYRKVFLDALRDAEKTGCEEIRYSLASSRGRIPVIATITPIRNLDGDHRYTAVMHTILKKD
jgi:PAS domain S-box-containing protein